VKLQRNVRAAIQANALAYPLPPNLRANRPARRNPIYYWAAAAAAIAIAIFAAREIPRPPAPGDVVAQEIFDTHLRSLEPGHLTDVESSDRHTVKPWFNGKLDFSPPVIDLAADGFPLAGGRMESIEGRPVAALVYMRAKHVISLYLWPDNEAISGSAHVQHGYNMIQWNDRGFAWWLVSDLNAPELEQFASRLRAAAGENR